MRVETTLAFLAIVISGCATGVDAQEDSQLQGTWLFEYVAGLPVIDRSPARIEFHGDGRVSGNASCNQISGGYELSGPGLIIGEVAATRRMCHETLMNQELRVLQTLPDVTAWTIENDLLSLLDAGGAEIFRASRIEL